jgi:hypothetical protein
MSGGASRRSPVSFLHKWAERAKPDVTSPETAQASLTSTSSKPARAGQPVSTFARRIDERAKDQGILLEDREHKVLEDELLVALASQIHARVVAARPDQEHERRHPGQAYVERHFDRYPLGARHTPLGAAATLYMPALDLDPPRPHKDEG